MGNQMPDGNQVMGYASMGQQFQPVVMQANNGFNMQGMQMQNNNCGQMQGSTFPMQNNGVPMQNNGGGQQMQGNVVQLQEQFVQHVQTNSENHDGNATANDDDEYSMNQLQEEYGDESY